MTSNQQFSLKWTNYTSHITNAFDSLRSKEDFCDVTLSCEGRKIRAHKVLLSACSTYFKEIFKENPCQHPVIIFKNVKYDDLFSIVVYMYQGEVNVEQDALPSFLHTAEMLTVQGLTEDDSSGQKSSTQVPPPPTLPQPQTIKVQKEKIHPVTQKITVSKHQPISIITAPAVTTLDQIIYSAITHSGTTSENIPDTHPAKRKRLVSIQNNTYQENITRRVTAQPQSETTDTETEDYLKPETEMDIAEYVSDSRQYRTDDDDEQEQIEIYEPGSQDESEEKPGDDFETKPKIATQTELGRLFSMAGTSDTKMTVSGQGDTSGDAATSKWSTCQFCKLTITSVNLWRHIRTQHTEQPQRQCEHCQKKFKNKYSLREHVRIAHEQKTISSGDIQIQNVQKID